MKSFGAWKKHCRISGRSLRVRGQHGGVSAGVSVRRRSMEKLRDLISSRLTTWAALGGAGKPLETQIYVFCVFGKPGEAPSYVFEISGKPWGGQLYVIMYLGSPGKFHYTFIKCVRGLAKLWEALVCFRRLLKVLVGFGRL